MKCIVLLTALACLAHANRDAGSRMDPDEPNQESPPMPSSAEEDQEVSPTTTSQVSVPHENSVNGRPIPREHHHSVHWRPDPGPDYAPYQPVGQYHYAPTPAPVKAYRPLPQAPAVPDTTARPRYLYEKPVYTGQQYYSEGCGCIPYRYA